MNTNELVTVVNKALSNASVGVFQEWASGLDGAIRDGIAAARKDLPDIQWNVRAAVASGNLVSFQYLAKGTHASTGRVLSWTGTAVAAIENGRISRLADWKEQAEVRELQLGNVPRVGVGGITGKWVGSVAGLGFSAQLHHLGTEVWGSIHLANVGRFDVSGVASGTDTQIWATDENGKTFAFSGAIAEHTISGLVEGHTDLVSLHRTF